MLDVCDLYVRGSCSQSIKDICIKSKFSRIEVGGGGGGGGGVGEGPGDRKKS